MKCYLLIEHTFMAMFNVTGEIARFLQCIKIDGDVHIADAQCCLQVFLSERRRLGHVGVTLTVGGLLHPTEQLRAQIHAVKQ